jgi:hypothetical protein
VGSAGDIVAAAGRLPGRLAGLPVCAEPPPGFEPGGADTDRPGYGLFEDAPKAWLSLIQAFAGGAILVMLTNSMIPESYDHAGKLAGIFTVVGFFLSVSIAVLEAGQVVASPG